MLHTHSPHTTREHMVGCWFFFRRTFRLNIISYGVFPVFLLSALMTFCFFSRFCVIFLCNIFFIYAFNPIQFEPHLYGWNWCLKSLCNLFASLQLNLKRTQSILNRFIFRVRLLIFHLNENALNFSCAASCIQPNRIAVVLNAVVDPFFSYHPLMVQCTVHHVVHSNP